MADYAAKPTTAKQDQQIIDLRKRMLAVFLNRCKRMVEVRNDGVWWRFLDPNSSWVCGCKLIVRHSANILQERGSTFASDSIHSKVHLESPSS